MKYKRYKNIIILKILKKAGKTNQIVYTKLHFNNIDELNYVLINITQIITMYMNIENLNRFYKKKN